MRLRISILCPMERLSDYRSIMGTGHMFWKWCRRHPSRISTPKFPIITSPTCPTLSSQKSHLPVQAKNGHFEQEKRRKEQSWDKPHFGYPHQWNPHPSRKQFTKQRHCFKKTSLPLCHGHHLKKFPNFPSLSFLIFQEFSHQVQTLSI